VVEVIGMGGIGSGAIGSGSLGGGLAFRVYPGRELNEEARERLSELPSWCQNAPEFRALAKIFANESARMRAMAAEVRDGLIPTRTNALLLPLWESLLRLTVNPPGFTEEQRRQLVVARLRQSVPDPSGRTWEARITEQIGPGWTYEEKEGAGEEQQRIIAYVPYPIGAPAFQFARRLLERERPAAWEITVVPGDTFILDKSKLDTTAFEV
jgi:hypothetical protein